MQRGLEACDTQYQSKVWKHFLFQFNDKVSQKCWPNAWISLLHKRQLWNDNIIPYLRPAAYLLYLFFYWQNLMPIKALEVFLQCNIKVVQASVRMRSAFDCAYCRLRVLNTGLEGVLHQFGGMRMRCVKQAPQTWWRGCHVTEHAADGVWDWGNSAGERLFS